MATVDVLGPFADARKDETEARYWVLKTQPTARADAVPINLSSATKVRMYYKRGNGAWAYYDSSTPGSPFTVVSAPTGRVRFIPPASFWQLGSTYIYFRIYSGLGLNVPRTKAYLVRVTEGA